MPGNKHGMGNDERIVCRVTSVANSGETMMNYSKKYSGVPIKRACVIAKS